MPVIKVYGVPEGTPLEYFATIARDLQASTAGVEELKIKPEQVSVFFPKDHLDVGLGEEIIAEVATAIKPERTPEVFARLAREVGMILRLGFPEAGLVEVFITTHDPKSQFWKSAIAPAPAPAGKCGICDQAMSIHRPGQGCPS